MRPALFAYLLRLLPLLVIDGGAALRALLASEWRLVHMLVEAVEVKNMPAIDALDIEKRALRALLFRAQHRQLLRYGTRRHSVEATLLANAAALSWISV